MISAHRVVLRAATLTIQPHAAVYTRIHKSPYFLPAETEVHRHRQQQVVVHVAHIELVGVLVARMTVVALNEVQLGAKAQPVKEIVLRRHTGHAAPSINEAVVRHVLFVNRIMVPRTAAGQPQTPLTLRLRLLRKQAHTCSKCKKEK